MRLLLGRRCGIGDADRRGQIQLGGKMAQRTHECIEHGHAVSERGAMDHRRAAGEAHLEPLYHRVVGAITLSTQTGTQFLGQLGRRSAYRGGLR